MRELFRPFTNQSKLAHLGLVVAGIAAFVGGVHATAFLLYDGTTTLMAMGGDAVAARRTAFMVGATLCWLVFAFGTIRAIGGPVLNLVWYPTLTVMLSASIGYSVVFGRRPDSVFTTGFLYSPTFVRDHAVVALPGIVGFLVVLLVALRVGFDDEEERRAWMRRHLSESFLEAYHPEFQHGEWNDEKRG